MKFVIARASKRVEEKPCEEAYSEQIERKDYKGDKVFHTVWFVDINTIKELMSYKKKYGRLIIDDAYLDLRLPLLMIYDDWVE